MHQQPNRDRNDNEDEQLRWKSQPAFLTKKEERTWKIREGVHAASDGLGQSTKERESAEGYNERRQPQPSDEGCIESTCQRADGQRARRRQRNRQSRVAPEFSEQNCAQPEQRPDGQLNSTGEDDGRHHQREQSDLD